MWFQQLCDAAEEWLGYAAVVQAATRGDGCYGVPGLFRSAFLRLQEIDVSALCDVEGMAAFAD